jgi:hypothetical protein
MQKNRMVFAWLAFCLSSVLAASGCTQGSTGAQGASGSTVMILQEGVSPSGYAGAADNNLAYNSTGTYTTRNFGAATLMRTGRSSDLTPIIYRGAIKFDLSPIVPATSTITNAYLTLYVESLAYTTFGVPSTVEVYALSQGWTEGSLDGTDGVSNWLTREAGTDWGAQGGSYEATLIDTESITQTGSVTFTITPAVVQNWLENSSANYGLLLKVTNESGNVTIVNFSSSDSTTSSQRPKLTVYYRLP